MLESGSVPVAGRSVRAARRVPAPLQHCAAAQPARLPDARGIQSRLGRSPGQTAGSLTLGLDQLMGLMTLHHPVSADEDHYLQRIVDGMLIEAVYVTEESYL